MPLEPSDWREISRMFDVTHAGMNESLKLVTKGVDARVSTLQTQINWLYASLIFTVSISIGLTIFALDMKAKQDKAEVKHEVQGAEGK